MNNQHDLSYKLLFSEPRVVRDPGANAVWAHYLKRWIWLNTLCTEAAMGAALLFMIGLLQ
ncbi:hypothetical protein ACJ7V3_18560 [Halomonas elongata]|uniref:hypothetical protein n=1 Tax=Halomonas elongata TaxID=2746 RepID=UPI0038D40CCC